MTITTRPTSGQDDYVEFCLFLRGLTGIDLTQYKRPQMERRLRSFYSTRGISKLTDTFEQLRRDPQQLDALLDRITINVSQLWRNPEQWELIEQRILPELAATGQIRAWSAGCSYGAEAYTLATLAHLVAPKARTLIQGTDIDKRMVAKARIGEFSQEDARSAPAKHLEAGFERIESGWRAKLAVRSLTRFDVGDLLKATPRPDSYDLILCRNTVIYFSEPIRDELHARLAGGLRSGGYMVIGSTERVAQPGDLGLTSTHPFIYRKA
jgi:chemotaxis protein methyltransferase CheR